MHQDLHAVNGCVKKSRLIHIGNNNACRNCQDHAGNAAYLITDKDQKQGRKRRNANGIPNNFRLDELTQKLSNSPDDQQPDGHFKVSAKYLDHCPWPQNRTGSEYRQKIQDRNPDRNQRTVTHPQDQKAHQHQKIYPDLDL